jgi:threonine aldolase
MNGTFIDLRSDTITVPSREMLETIVSAGLGDSLRDEDPTVNDLQRKSASLFNIEEGLLLISGTMANQVAVNAWCRRGTIVVAMENSHIARKESISTSVISGCSIFPMQAEKGLLNIDDLRTHLGNQENMLYVESFLSPSTSTGRGFSTPSWKREPFRRRRVPAAIP